MDAQVADGTPQEPPHSCCHRPSVAPGTHAGQNGGGIFNLSGTVNGAIVGDNVDGNSPDNVYNA